VFLSLFSCNKKKEGDREKKMLTYKGAYNSANVMLDEVEKTTEEQIRGFLEHPAFAHTYIAIMPDCHAGAGAVIGYTAKMNGYIIPDIVGRDVGCGILAIKLGQDFFIGENLKEYITLNFTLQKLDNFIKKRIPSGFSHRREPPISKYDKEVVDIIQLANKLELDSHDVLCQLGTLGGGNHFIELNKDPEDNYWLVIHSGSRNFGSRIAGYYQDKAKELMKKMFLDQSKSADVFKGLEFLPLGHGGEEYIEAMKIAQGFASSNRKLMAKMILEGVFSLDMEKVEQIESVHNYINFEDNIVRKGAIQALEGQRVVIPLNMRDGYISWSRKRQSEMEFFSSSWSGSGSLSQKSEGNFDNGRISK